ncbi:MAG: hypothetical protein IT158_24565 [Bryobacterales bacterium]|nr:hypothetical protein [Bryobacterales bacterium]
MNRRQFATGLMLPLGSLAAQQRRGSPARERARKRFSEVAASLYAWDLLDEGVDPVLDTLQETARANSTYLVALMHWEKRPLTDFYYPHNPRRKTYFPEDSRAYWRPRLEHYRETKIKPRTSEREELKGKDWLELLVAAARKRKWKTGAEISHTVLDFERARGEYAWAVQKDIYGNPLAQLVCVNNPDSRNYLIGLFTDLVINYDLDFVQTCLVPFASGRLRAMAGLGGEQHEPGTFGFATWGGGGASAPVETTLLASLGGCFCPSCGLAAKAQGLDLQAVRRAMLPLADMLDHAGPAEGHYLALLRASNTTPLAMLLRHSEMFDWLKFRCASLTDLFRDVHAAVRRINPRIDLRLNAYISSNPELGGLDLAALKPYLGSVRSSDYSEQSGSAERLDHKRRFLFSVRAAIGDEMHFLSAIGVRPRATPELIRQGVAISSECGADGLSLGHYDGAPLRNLEAIAQGLDEADVTVVTGAR